MVPNPKVGNKYWTIKNVTETSNYETNDPPPKPWIGLLTETKLPSTNISKLCCFDKETGEPDHDTNASAWVGYGDIFFTETEARVEFVRATLSWCVNQQRAIVAAMEDLEKNWGK